MKQRRLAIAVTSALFGPLLIGHTPALAADTTTAQLAPIAAASSKKVDARTLLKKLRVVAEPRTSTYERSKFKHWNDADRDGCYARAEVLKRESKRKTRHRGACTITSGKWTSIYDGKTVTSASKIEIDHVVPLAEAWRSGANRWSKQKREAYANDLGYKWSLRAVTSATNRAKADKDPARWLPNRKACVYVSAWVGVKARWDLSIDPVEKFAISAQLDKCGASSRMVLKPGKPQIAKLVPQKVKRTPAPKPSTPNYPVIHPGAFCKVADIGARGVSASGVVYTCKRVNGDQPRWRR